MSDAFELEICQGKYRYRYEAGKQEVWRNGDIWPTMNGKLIGDKFVFSLAVELDEALKECEALRSKIAEMEKQEPVAWIRGRDDYRRRKLSFEKPAKSSPDKLHWSPLYALPGAQTQGEGK